jgi:opacity protein-like surface antigen
MRTRIAFVLLAVAAHLACARPARAQGREIEVSPFGGAVFFLGDGPTRYALERTDAAPLTVDHAGYEDSWTAGLGLGLRFNELLSVEATLGWIPTWLSGSNGDGTDVYAYTYGLTGIVRLPTNGPLHPYSGMGLGAKTFDYSGRIHSRSQWTSSFVAGMSLDVGGGQSVYLQGRDLLSPFDSGVAGVRGGWENDVMISAGVTWRIPLGPHRERPTKTRRGGFFPG